MMLPSGVATAVTTNSAGILEVEVVAFEEDATSLNGSMRVAVVAYDKSHLSGVTISL